MPKDDTSACFYEVGLRHSIRGSKSNQVMLAVAGDSIEKLASKKVFGLWYNEKPSLLSRWI